MFEFVYTRAEIATQIAALPPLFFFYLRTIAIVNLSSVLFIRRPQARWVLAAILFIGATNVPIFLSLGLVKLGSIPHLVVWVPLVLYLANQLRTGKVNAKTFFGMWCLVVMLLDLVSVVFDVRDSFQYLFLGDRGTASETVSAEPPIATLFAIAVSATALTSYALGAFRRGSSPDTLRGTETND